MRAIHKFPLCSVLYLNLPEGSLPLTLQYQGADPTLWCEVETSLPPGPPRAVIVVGTGHPLPTDINRCTYLGTLQQSNGLVWHYYLGPPL